MRPVTEATLRQVVEELGGFSWSDAELAELIAPKFGIITDFQDLLRELSRLREQDLGATAPSGPVRLPQDGT